MNYYSLKTDYPLLYIPLINSPLLYDLFALMRSAGCLLRILLTHQYDVNACFSIVFT